jgi:hypothetical protein
MISLSTKATIASIVTVVAAGVTTIAAVEGGTPNAAAGQGAQAGRGELAGKAGRVIQADPPAITGKIVKKHLPIGVSTATSFWDAATASGLPMSYHTIASPYWPLGTKVKITYGGKSVTGVVEDFGPAEWAVAQHNPPAIVDLSEKMMRYLTGAASNSVTVKFEVMQLGRGGVYRHSGTGYDMATGTT